MFQYYVMWNKPTANYRIMKIWVDKKSKEKGTGDMFMLSLILVANIWIN